MNIFVQGTRTLIWERNVNVTSESVTDPYIHQKVRTASGVFSSRVCRHCGSPEPAAIVTIQLPADGYTEVTT